MAKLAHHSEKHNKKLTKWRRNSSTSINMTSKTDQLPMTDQELEEFLKEKQINPLNIGHIYEPNIKENARSCITCDFVVLRCWLCVMCLMLQRK
jgi:hypothetical protein